MSSTTVSKEQELKNCTFVKTALMILIVFYHSVLFWKGNWFYEEPIFEARGLALLAQWLNTFHIYGFVLVSGYLFYYLKQEKGKYRRFDAFLKNKAKRLLVPYFFVALVWAMPFHYLWNEFDLASAVTKFLLGTAPGQLWFLLMLFLVFAMVWPLSELMEKHGIAAIMVSGVFYGIGMIGTSLMPNVFQIWTACKYVIFFVMGFQLRQYGTRLLMRLPHFFGWLSAFCSLP